MKVPLSWLREFVSWPWSPEELAERLTMAGVKVETIQTVGDGVRGVVAARVLKVEPHPSPGQGRYWVASVDAGTSRHQVVAGIANMRPGDIVAYAPPGSVLPGEWRIGVASVRGVASEGMLLSLSELVLGEKPREGEGVLVLPGDIAPGADLALALGLPETTLELDLTPNYAAHCQSMLGVAREVAAQTGAGPAGVRLPDPHAFLRPSGAPAAEACDVTILAPDHCPRYVARVIRDVKLGPSPWTVQFRVLAAGMRPINNIVDATNYVMLEYGQPLHAFDLARLRDGHIVVRLAEAGETIVTLDGVTRKLSADTLVIADPERAVAVAGVMGGENSEVTEKTRDILLEAAWFDPRSVRRTATRLGLLSEAASRFDKGVDPEAAELASARAAGLIAEMAGGRVAPGSVDRNPRPYAPREVVVRTSWVSTILGVELERAEVASYLGLLGFRARPAPWQGPALGQGGGVDEALPGDRRGREAAEGRLAVTIPSWRTDVSGEADVIEEVARIYGYNRIPSSLPRGAATVGLRPRWARLADRAKRALVDQGFSEVITFSLVDPDRDAALSATGRAALVLANPLSSRQSAMRTSLLGGLVEAVARNASHGEPSLRLFELGPVYLAAPGELGPENLPLERRQLAAVAAGSGFGASWRGPGESPDFFYAKGLVAVLLRELGVGEWRVERGSDRRFHPGRQAALLVARGGRARAGDDREGPDPDVVEVGVFGELHPRVLESYDIQERVIAMELDFDVLAEASAVAVRVVELPRYPAVSRDVAVILPESVEARRIEDVIRRSAGELGVGVELFDVYRGHPIPPGQRSTAWRVVYRSPDRSLTDAEVDEAHQRVRTALERELGAVLR